MTGLVIGSMAPDFEYFIRLRVKSVYSHTWAGLFWFDVPLGLVLTLLYGSLIKDKLIDHLPGLLNNRFQQFKNAPSNNYSFYYLIIIGISVLTGAASHIIWDGFTHPTGYFVGVIPILTRTISLGNRHVYIYKLIQHASTIAGLGFILLIVLSLPQGNRIKISHITIYWMEVIIISIIVLLIRILTGLSFNEYGNLVVTLITGCLLGLIIASLLTNKKEKYN